MREKRYKNNHSTHFWKKNGVFLALAVSLLAVGGVLIAGLSQTPHVKSSEENSAVDYPVEQKVTDQPDDRTTANSTTTTKVTTTTKAEQKELYVSPLSDDVLTPFSIEQPIYSQTMDDWRLHPGVDLGGKAGQEVKVIAAGTVLSVEKDALWGNVITVDHSVGVISRYAGVMPSVKKGDKVEAGGVLGTLGELPCESAMEPHLHLEMLVDNNPIDPLTVLGLSKENSQESDRE